MININCRALLCYMLVLLACVSSASCIEYSSDAVVSSVRTTVGDYTHVMYSNGNEYVVDNSTGYTVFISDNFSLSIQTALDLTSESYGEVLLKHDVYPSSVEFTVPQGVLLRGENSPVIYPTSNINMTRIKPGGSIDSITYEPFRYSGYSKNVIRMCSEDRYWAPYLTLYKSSLDKIAVQGNLSGSAILFDATIDDFDRYIDGVTMHDISLLGCEYGIHSVKRGAGWINSIHVDGLYLQGQRIGIYDQSLTPSVRSEQGFDYRVFSDVAFQWDSRASYAIYMNGRYNRVDCTIADWEPSVAVVLGTDSNSNYVVVGVDKSKILDLGQQLPYAPNTIIGYIG